MKIPKKFKQTRGRGANKKVYHFELVKIYPNFIQYKCLETGAMECFQKSFFAIKQAEEFFKNDKNSN